MAFSGGMLERGYLMAKRDCYEILGVDRNDGCD
jgi:hypothetical protein